MVAELRSEDGTTDIEIVPRAENKDVEIKEPVFTDGKCTGTTVKINKKGISGEKAVLKVTLIDNNGQEISVSRIVKFFGAGALDEAARKRTTTLAANMALTLGTVFSIGVGILYLWVFPAEQYDAWPHFMLLSFYLFVIIGIGMIVVSLWDKSPQLGILNMEKIEDKPARIVLILWGLLIVTMIGLYIFFNGH